MYRIIFPLLFMLLSCSHDQQTDQKVIFLQNNSIKIGVLPDVGGRMVFYGEPNEENLLFSDSALWNEPEIERVVPELQVAFKSYDGFITWVGPQSEWWSHQELIPQKKGSVWPPDPYLIYSDFLVSELTDTSVILTGPESPISGVQLTKYFVLTGNELRIKVEAKNIRNTSVSWDLWSNARFNAFTIFKVPVDSSGIIRIEGREDKSNEIVANDLHEGYFTFKPQLPVDPSKKRISKAFLYPEEGKMLVFKNDVQLCIEFEKVPLEQIHPEQALVEVYNSIDAKGLTNVLELEHHSAYRKLNPGDIIELSEIWRLSK